MSSESANVAPMDDKAIEALVNFVEAAEALAAILDMSVAKAAHAMLKGAQLMSQAHADGASRALAQMSTSKAKH